MLLAYGFPSVYDMEISSLAVELPFLRMLLMIVAWHVVMLGILFIMVGIIGLAGSIPEYLRYSDDLLMVMIIFSGISLCCNTIRSKIINGVW